MTHRTLHLLLTSAAVAVAAAMLAPMTIGWAQTAAPKSAPDNPAALPDQEIGRRIHGEGRGPAAAEDRPGRCQPLA